MTFYILRHAHKDKGDFFNPKLRHQDEPLTKDGMEAARRLADDFAGRQIAAIYISGYQRTAQTARELATRLGITPVIDERLNEIDNGRFDGMTEEQIAEAFPDEWAAFKGRERDFRFPGGETGQEAQDRIASFIEEKRKQHEGQNVVMISHEGLLRVWMCRLMGLPPYRRGDFQVDFCGLMEIEWQQEYGRWKLMRFNSSTAALNGSGG